MFTSRNMIDWLRGLPVSGDPLTELLEAVAARAVGLWRSTGMHLELLGFQAVPDMPSEVCEGFSQATRCVALTQTDLGIVQAVVRRQPAVAWRATTTRLDPSLPGSASWLERFEASQSVACPISRGDAVFGVLAAACVQPMSPGDSRWLLLTGMAADLAADWAGAASSPLVPPRPCHG